MSIPATQLPPQSGPSQRRSRRRPSSSPGISPSPPRRLSSSRFSPVSFSRGPSSGDAASAAVREVSAGDSLPTTMRMHFLATPVATVSLSRASPRCFRAVPPPRPSANAVAIFARVDASRRDFSSSFVAPVIARMHFSAMVISRIPLHIVAGIFSSCWLGSTGKFRVAVVAPPTFFKIVIFFPRTFVLVAVRIFPTTTIFPRSVAEILVGSVGTPSVVVERMPLAAIVDGRFSSSTRQRRRAAGVGFAATALAGRAAMLSALPVSVVVIGRGRTSGAY